MSRRSWIEDKPGLLELRYMTFRNIPMKRAKSGVVVDLTPGVLERLAAKAILSHRVPIRGRELRVLRAALGISLNKFGLRLGLTSVCILHWEQALETRLLPVNEIAVRVLCAEELGVELPGRLSQLLGAEPVREITVEITRPRGRRRSTDTARSRE